MSKTPLSLTVEVEGTGTTEGVGYAIAFEAPKFDFSTPEFDAWRDDVKALVIKTGDKVFDKDIAVSSRAMKDLVNGFAALNAKHGETVGNIGDVPALQIDSVEGKRFEVSFTPEDAAKGAFRSTRDDYAPRDPGAVNATGSGCVTNAFRCKFTFMGKVSAQKTSLFNKAATKIAANDPLHAPNKRPKFGM